jgi:hypothetical protein
VDKYKCCPDYEVGCVCYIVKFAWNIDFVCVCWGRVGGIFDTKVGDCAII